MKLKDQLKMSLSNLWKRKVRTFLTILGVVIGVASIVVMMSLGIGLRESMMADLANYASLNQVQVSAPYEVSSSSDSAADKYLSDKTVQSLKGIEHVSNVYPVIQTSAYGKYGRYLVNLQIMGMPVQAIERLNIKVGEGELPKSGEELEFFFGGRVLQDYYDPRTGSMPYWDRQQELDWDLMARPSVVYFDTAAYDSVNMGGGGMDDGENRTPPAKKYQIKTSGVEYYDEDIWTSTAWNVYCDIEALKAQLKKVYRNRAIPGQPTGKTGRPLKELYYSSLVVEVDSFDYVTEVQKSISDLGYEAYSDAEWIAEEQKTMGMIEAVLGGIGAVSLLVAAIGIANTMMMSIYERTKEIGVMKVLGCDMRNIGGMFLMEAGYIGLFGGLAGIAFSYIISFIINKAAGGGDVLGLSAEGMNISMIPPWLAVAAVFFAIVIGMLAGFFPARRAMHLSALAAIKNE